MTDRTGLVGSAESWFSTRKAIWLAMVILLAFAACSDEGTLPPKPSMAGFWVVTNLAHQTETRLELDHRGGSLTGSWNRLGQQIAVSGVINDSNEFVLSGQANSQTFIFNAEANDGLSRFEGSLSVYDVRGDRVSLQLIRGERD